MQQSVKLAQANVGANFMTSEVWTIRKFLTWTTRHLERRVMSIHVFLQEPVRSDRPFACGSTLTLTSRFLRMSVLVCVRQLTPRRRRAASVRDGRDAFRLLVLTCRRTYSTTRDRSAGRRLRSKALMRATQTPTRSARARGWRKERAAYRSLLLLSVTDARLRYRSFSSGDCAGNS